MLGWLVRRQIAKFERNFDYHLAEEGFSIMVLHLEARIVSMASA